MTTLPYQKKSLSVNERVADLIPRLSLRDKAGLMFHTMISIDIPLDQQPEQFPIPSVKTLIEMGMNHFNIHGSPTSARELANWHNELQELAASIGRGIPVTISSDPRHSFGDNPMTAMAAGCFSQWPESLGFVALADEARNQMYADIVRQEYVAVGIRSALHPQVDLATEYRWSRIGGSLGEDADLAGRLGAAQVRGLQGKTIGPTSVSATVKHFPGGGPTQDGLDTHFSWGREQIYPGGQWEYHLQPFRTTISAGASCVMPAYGLPIDTEYEEVAFAYNRGVITDLLRGELDFKGIVISDWLVLKGLEGMGDMGEAKAWGMEDKTIAQRIVKALDAGIDQFGGDFCVDELIKAVEDGLVAESRLDRSVALLLREKFLLGLFDNPYVDPEAAASLIGKEEFVQAGWDAQRDALTLLSNKNGTLPLTRGIKVFSEGFKDLGTDFYTAVDTPAEADVIIVRLSAPYEVVGEGEWAHLFHHGSLEFDPKVLEKVADLAKHAPVIVDLYLDRPAVLGSLVDSASAIIVNFGVRPLALLEVLFGVTSPKGKLPFDMPRSMAAVVASRTDTPFDTENPVFRFGHGLRYQ